MAWWIFAAQAAASGTSLLANEKASKAQYDAANNQADLYAKQAERIQEAAEFNVQQVQFAGQKLEGRQIVAYAASGGDTSSGSALAVMEDTARQLNTEVATIRREADFQSEMALLGAQSIRDQANATRKAQKFQNYAQFGSQMVATGTDYYKWSKTQKALETTAAGAQVQSQSTLEKLGKQSGLTNPSHIKTFTQIMMQNPSLLSDRKAVAENIKVGPPSPNKSILDQRARDARKGRGSGFK